MKTLKLKPDGPSDTSAARQRERQRYLNDIYRRQGVMPDRRSRYTPASSPVHNVGR